jgi:hypothetical protein
MQGSIFWGKKGFTHPSLNQGCTTQVPWRATQLFSMAKNVLRHTKYDFMKETS